MEADGTGRSHADCRLLDVKGGGGEVRLQGTELLPPQRLRLSSALTSLEEFKPLQGHRKTTAGARPQPLLHNAVPLGNSSVAMLPSQTCKAVGAVF